MTKISRVAEFCCPFNTRLTEEDYNFLKSYAKERDLGMSEALRDILAERRGTVTSHLEAIHFHESKAAEHKRALEIMNERELERKKEDELCKQKQEEDKKKMEEKEIQKILERKPFGIYREIRDFPDAEFEIKLKELLAPYDESLRQPLETKVRELRAVSGKK